MHSAPSLHPSSEPVLSLRGLTKRFGATLALDGVDLTIGKGEVVALLGANGAGKSTLAKIASGVYLPDAGAVRLNGREMRLTSPRAAQENGIVTVHQATDQLGVAGITVAENLVLDDLCSGHFSAFAGSDRIRRKAIAVAAHIDLDIPLDEDFGALGPAQRQLVAIARAVAANASVLILDEPTASLGAAEADRLFAVVAQLQARGVATLYISHRMRDIRRVATRVVVMRNGQTVYSQARPFDLALSIKHMIGRDIGAGGGAAGVAVERAPWVQLRQVQLRQGARPFDLDIRKGEILALTGALGAGKSRLLGCLFGIHRFIAGYVAIDGRQWQPASPSHSVENGVFLAGEDRWRSSLLPPLTPGADISGTIALPFRHKWFPGGIVGNNRERSIAEKAIAALGIRCKGARDTLDMLSGGNQQKVVMARWQAVPSKLLLLDEPFQGVDIGARHDLIDAIRAGQKDSATLIATSDVEEAIEAADRVAVIHDHTLVGLHDLRTEGSGSLLASLGAMESATEQEGRD